MTWLGEWRQRRYGTAAIARWRLLWVVAEDRAVLDPRRAMTLDSLLLRRGIGDFG